MLGELEEYRTNTTYMYRQVRTLIKKTMDIKLKLKNIIIYFILTILQKLKCYYILLFIT